MKKVGIDSLSFYVPSLYVDIEELALERNIPADKLVYGLGLKKMSTPDFDEDSASIAANSILKLITENNINPTEIGRVYLGTESGVDASKPTSSYVIEILEDISRDLMNYDLEFRIQELESKFSKDLSEATFNELKELKKKKNIN